MEKPIKSEENQTLLMVSIMMLMDKIIEYKEIKIKFKDKLILLSVIIILYGEQEIISLLINRLIHNGLKLEKVKINKQRIGPNNYVNNYNIT